MTRMLPGLLALAAILWLLFAGVRTFEQRIAPLDPDSAIVIEEPDAALHPAAAPKGGRQGGAHLAAAPFCTIPGPPKPLARDRRNPLIVKEMA